MSYPPPPLPGQTPVHLPPPIRSGPRRYDLDGLRATAMFLGVVLHGAIPFVPYWERGDSGGSFLWGLFEYIHTWRMPLFFLLSGYFTTMLWRGRGLRALIRHRLRWVGLPLFIGVFTILPLVIIGFIAGFVFSGLSEDDLNAIAAADQYQDPNEAAQGATDRGPDGDDAEKDEKTGGGEPGGDETGGEFGFAHLWFLWQLLWLVAGFSMVALALTGFKRLAGREPPGLIGLGVGWLLPVASLAIATTFTEPVLGPDTSDSFIPAWNVLLYYACFFAFGSLRYRTPGDQPEPIDRLGRGWMIQLPASVGLFLLLFYDRVPDPWSDVGQVGLAWLVSFGAIGLFRSRAAAPSFRVRWFSDGAYWMYLIHLPIVVALQGVARALGLPAIAGFVFVVAFTTALLVLSYRYLVRYSPIGTLLNGRRRRDEDTHLQQQLATMSRQD